MEPKSTFKKPRRLIRSKLRLKSHAKEVIVGTVIRGLALCFKVPEK